MSRLTDAFDPLRPYLSLLKWLGFCVVASALVVGGCRHGEKEQAKEDRAAIQAAKDEAAGHKAQVSVLSIRLAAIDAQAAKAKAEADAQAEAAKEAVKRAEQEKAQLRQEIKGIEREIAEAKRDPECNRLMETKLCAVLR